MGSCDWVLNDFDDDELRAECNRRWGEDDCPMAKTLRFELDEAQRQLRVERDEWREHRDRWAKTANERDEWKRRAEMAEASAAQERNAKENALLLAVLRGDVTGTHRITREITTCMEDMSKGLASKPAPRPDNSVAFLDEDLLCEDA